MFQLIGGIFKYTLLTLTILILSHVIEIQGVTVSQHILHGMHFITGYSPRVQANRITADISRSMQTHVNQLNKIGETENEETRADEHALTNVIKKSQ